MIHLTKLNSKSEGIPWVQQLLHNSCSSTSHQRLLLAEVGVSEMVFLNKLHWLIVQEKIHFKSWAKTAKHRLLLMTTTSLSFHKLVKDLLPNFSSKILSSHHFRGSIKINYRPAIKCKRRRFESLLFLKTNKTCWTMKRTLSFRRWNLRYSTCSSVRVLIQTLKS